MVAHFFQTLFARKGSASEPQPKDSAHTPFDDQFEEYVAPKSATPAPKSPAFDADPATRRSLIQMWMASLPVLIRPIRLVHDYEQIAFTIALNWGEQRDLKRYLQQLIFKDESGSVYLAPEVFQELLLLDRFLDDLRGVNQAVGPLLRTLDRANTR